MVGIPNNPIQVTRLWVSKPTILSNPHHQINFPHPHPAHLVRKTDIGLENLRATENARETGLHENATGK
jgi:hypothetical protein